MWEPPVDMAEETGRRDVLLIDYEDERVESESRPSQTMQGKQPATRNVFTENQVASGTGAEHAKKEMHLQLLSGLASLRLKSKKTLM